METELTQLQDKISKLDGMMKREPKTIEELRALCTLAQQLPPNSREGKMLRIAQKLYHLRREYEDNLRCVMERAAVNNGVCPACLGKGRTKAQGYLRFDARSDDKLERYCFLCRS